MTESTTPREEIPYLNIKILGLTLGRGFFSFKYQVSIYDIHTEGTCTCSHNRIDYPAYYEELEQSNVLPKLALLNALGRQIDLPQVLGTPVSAADIDQSLSAVILLKDDKPACNNCHDKGWVYRDDETRTTCPCHY